MKRLLEIRTQRTIDSDEEFNDWLRVMQKGMKLTDEMISNLREGHLEIQSVDEKGVPFATTIYDVSVSN